MEASPAAPERRTSGRLLLILTLAGFATRAAFLLAEPATSPVADERTWIDWARNLSSEKVGFSPFRTKLVFYPPLYHYFIAVLETALGSLAAVRWAQVLLGSLLVPAVGRVGALAFGEPAGLAAAAITAFYPDLVWFSAHFWSETFFLVLLWWAIERLLAADNRGAAAALAAGILWGLAILTRETILYFTPLPALWLLWRRPRGAGLRAAVFALAAIAVVAPWTWRNWVVYRGFIPVSTAGGLNLFQGNAPLTRQQVYNRYRSVSGRLEQYQYARRMGLQAILERQPWWLLEKLRHEMPMFWEADSLALVHIKRGAYGSGIAPGWAAAAAIVVLVPYLAVLALAVAGAATLPVTRPRVLLLLFLLYYVAIHVATHGFARYRLPVMPVLFLLAGAAWAALRRGELPRVRGRTLALAAALASVLVLCLIPSFRRNLGHPAFGFADGGDSAAEEAPPP
jgi:4-amino-4-deoxy-L-arabinose transferase-like glycosyltransferase